MHFLELPLYSFSENARQVNPKKIYAVDPAYLAYSIKPGFERGAQLENGVFNELRKAF